MNKAETASTDFVFLFFWLLDSDSWILLFLSIWRTQMEALASKVRRLRVGLSTVKAADWLRQLVWP
jgi:hypothetical protein